MSSFEYRINAGFAGGDHNTARRTGYNTINLYFCFIILENTIGSRCQTFSNCHGTLGAQVSIHMSLLDAASLEGERRVS